MTDLAVSVRDLAAFCHRSGDIDHRFTPAPTAAQGIAGHQRLYRRRAATYQREFSVEHHCRAAGQSLQIRGRADGYDPELGLVEEIKTCRVTASAIPETVSRLHMAQARLYAAIIAIQCDLQSLEVRLTWLNIDTDEEYPLIQSCSRRELEAFLRDTLDRFAGWIGQLAEFRGARHAHLASLNFPHGAFRAGQREIAELVYKCADQAGQLMVEAPTGIGKTVAVLYPALKAVVANKHDALVFATARTLGRRAAQDCLALLAGDGVGLGGLTLTAREQICFSPGRACHGDDCPFARGYYDRLPAALEAALAAGSLPRETIEAIAKRFEVCPYQLADDLLPWVDIVIADIHYLYSLYPVLGNRIVQDGRRWSVLLDEAHNLPDRARGMYSACLRKRELMAVKRPRRDAVGRALERINRAMLKLQGETWQTGDLDSRTELPEPLVNSLGDFLAATGEAIAAEVRFLQANPELMDFYFKVAQWLRVAEHWGDDFLLELERGGGAQGLSLKLNCLDPSRLLGECHKRMHATVAFSATLSPAPWMQTQLGLGERVVCRRVQSPFLASQLDVVLATGVDTRYGRREQSLGQLCDLIGNWLAQVRGNCIVFFPSYRYMESALEALEERQAFAARELWRQRPDLDQAGREELLQGLVERRNVAAFCILGGVFGEGIDLPGDHLSSVVVVGVGLPRVGREREQLREWYQRRTATGFEYAYLYPGMQKVDQALGRVVRTASDRGSALLIDSRYDRPSYRRLLPPWWQYRIQQDTAGTR